MGTCCHCEYICFPLYHIRVICCISHSCSLCMSVCGILSMFYLISITLSGLSSFLQIYLMDIHIWYTLLSAICGAVMGARARLGEVCSIFHPIISLSQGILSYWSLVYLHILDTFILSVPFVVSIDSHGAQAFLQFP